MASATDTAENKRIARRYPEEVATERDLDRIDELHADDFVEHGPFGVESHGPEEDKEQMRTFLEAFPDLEATVEEIVAEGDTVAMRVRLRGTHQGDFMGIDPTGETFDVQNMVFTRIEEGKIVERWVNPDSLGLLEQLGVVDSPVE
ncbi:hypothetical protein C479_07263 [Halovivax asiaticus JCM 14624]|uniref:Ester cyclase n=1 Tax=Halovivax asiaticus JCM 14624 TaxID=1227490 RepID=M0BLB5_9EURY|nr:ester cyclase [Halovivax asiaticus]ELZ11088.1 hypothetical protein C479_07263 [Halovivax asiaticus JCM 14624]